jgi:hypothetical protein
MIVFFIFLETSGMIGTLNVSGLAELQGQPSQSLV